MNTSYRTENKIGYTFNECLFRNHLYCKKNNTSAVGYYGKQAGRQKSYIKFLKYDNLTLGSLNRL